MGWKLHFGLALSKTRTSRCARGRGGGGVGRQGRVVRAHGRHVVHVPGRSERRCAFVAEAMPRWTAAKPSDCSMRRKKYPTNGSGSTTGCSCPTSSKGPCPSRATQASSRDHRRAGSWRHNCCGERGGGAQLAANDGGDMIVCPALGHELSQFAVIQQTVRAHYAASAVLNGSRHRCGAFVGVSHQTSHRHAQGAARDAPARH